MYVRNWWFLAILTLIMDTEFFFDMLHLNRDMSFGTWNLRSMYRSGSLMKVARELAKYKLDLVGVQEVRWDKEGL
jgi:hypothetical protein